MKDILKKLIENECPLLDKRFVSEIVDQLITYQEFEEREDLQQITEDDFSKNYEHGTLRLPQRRKLATVIKGKFFECQLWSALDTRTNDTISSLETCLSDSLWNGLEVEKDKTLDGSNAKGESSIKNV